MALGWDPSHDADRWIDEQERGQEAERVWWQANGDRVLQIAAALIAGPGGDVWDLPAKSKELIDMAASIVQEVTYRQEPY